MSKNTMIGADDLDCVLDAGMVTETERKGSEPLITIGICCYREGEWLERCWETVLTQDDDRWEAVLVMDGGADDETKNIFKFLKHDKLRKFECKERLRHGGTRNKAVEMTRTTYHLYVDADDALFPQTVRCLLDGFKECPGAALVYGDIEWFGDYNLVYRNPREMTWDVLARTQGFQGSGAAYSVKVWQAMGGLAKEMHASGSDFDFNIGLAEAGYKFYHVGKTVYRYRKYGTSNSEQHGFRNWEKREMTLARHPKFFEDRKRARDFLSHGYVYSFKNEYEENNLEAARAIARKALKKGYTGRSFFPMLLLSVLPLSVFRAVVPIWRFRHRLKLRSRKN